MKREVPIDEIMRLKDVRDPFAQILCERARAERKSGTMLLSADQFEEYRKLINGLHN